MSRKRRLTGEAALEAAFTRTDHAPLLAAWGVELSDDMLRLALTHRSFANENGNLPNNERLEFLGDAVLGLSVAEQLYRQFPDRSESDISKMRAGVVNMYALADVARELGMGDHLLLGRGEMMTGGSDKHSIIADSVEAMLGAIYLEKGFDVAL
ncbi:MAG TPA: ribonuclease III, partial [Corynebacterium nuruki]|nr:ribonuclease III [Corynebacterium nuruki]